MLYEISTNIQAPYDQAVEFIGELMTLVKETQQDYCFGYPPGVRPAWIMKPSVDQTEGQSWLITMFNIDKATIDILNLESDFIVTPQD